MNSEKKLIACSILALVIGISSVLPLTFLMSTTAKAEDTFDAYFSFAIPYAYWLTNDGPVANPKFEPSWYDEMNETNSVSDQHIIVLNFTLNDNPENELADSIVEYYKIEITTDKDPVENVYFTVGTARNSSYVSTDFHFMRNDWFDTKSFDSLYGGGGGYTNINWVAGQSIMWPDSGSGSGTTGSSGTARRVSALREAETVSITVYRIGAVVFTDNSTVVTTANNEIVEQVQLEKYGEEGWLYNNLVSDDELATVDLFHPVRFEDQFPQP